jgi:hypothetical protein
MAHPATSASAAQLEIRQCISPNSTFGKDVPLGKVAVDTVSKRPANNE